MEKNLKITRRDVALQRLYIKNNDNKIFKMNAIYYNLFKDKSDDELLSMLKESIEKPRFLNEDASKTLKTILANRSLTVEQRAIFENLTQGETFDVIDKTVESDMIMPLSPIPPSKFIGNLTVFSSLFIIISGIMAVILVMSIKNIANLVYICHIILLTVVVYYLTNEVRRLNEIIKLK